MRRYTPDSPEAMVRIVAAVLLADGAVDASETELLDKKSIAARLGISACGFDRVVREYCDDLKATGLRSKCGQVKLSMDTFHRLLDDIQDNALRLRLTSIIIDIIDADGSICPDEASMAGEAMSCWGTDIVRRADKEA